MALLDLVFMQFIYKYIYIYRLLSMLKLHRNNISVDTNSFVFMQS